MLFCLLKNDDGTFSTYERKRTTPLLEVSILNCYFVSWTNKLCNLHVRVESNIEFEPFLITSLKRLKLEDYYSLSRPHIYLLDLSINKTDSPLLADCIYKLFVWADKYKLQNEV